MQRPLRRLVLRAFIAALVGLAGCGGGGGGESVPASNAFASFKQTTNPSGARTDVAALNLFAFAAGDTVNFVRLDARGQNGTVTRIVSGLFSAAGPFTVTETDSTAAGVLDQTIYMRLQTGSDLAVQLQDPLGVSGILPGLLAGVPSLDEYVTPLYALGAVRTIEAQGDIGADADGDGKTDSYRFVYSQVFRGFEDAIVLGATRALAHFTNAVSLTLRPTSGKGDLVMTATEDVYFAPQIGMVRRVSSAVVENGVVVEPAYTIEATSATVAGRTYP